MKIVTVIGARPQFIKAAAVSRVFRKKSGIEEIIVHTGQHFDANMSDVFFKEMDIPYPKHHLGINSLSHGAMTGQMLEKIEQVLLEEKPDWVLIYGDTNSTIAGALAAKKLHISVAHVEAGLRSFNMAMPEEINRILTDRISDILFCPTDAAVNNLKNEGFENFSVKIIKNGDVMQDAAMFYSQKKKKPTFDVPEHFSLATIHRAENTDDKERLVSIFEALDTISANVPVVLPLHPRTKKFLDKYNIKTENIIYVNPVGYLEMVYLLDRCKMVFTDSGGLQKEAFFFKKPCVTLRDETEWIELVENNFNIVVGADKDRIIGVWKNHKFNTDYEINLYGNGKASEVIIEALTKK